MNLTITLQWKDPLNGRYYNRRVQVDTEGMIPTIGHEIAFDGPTPNTEHRVRIERIKHGTHQENELELFHQLYIGPSVLVSPVTDTDALAMRQSWRSVIPKAFHFHGSSQPA